MSFNWSTLEISAETKQTKSASQVEAEYISSQEKAARMAAEAKAWESMEITATTKIKSSAEVIAAKSSKSVLDGVIGSVPTVSSSLGELSTSVNSVITGFAGGTLGNVLKGNTGASKQSTAAVDEIINFSGVGLFGGNGVSGGFNPAGDVLSTDLTTASAGGFVNLAKTVFTSGSTEAAATVDIYAGTLNSPQNKIKSVLSDVMDVVGSAVGGSLSKTLRDLAGKTNIVGGIVSEASAKNVLSRFKSDLLSGVPLTKDGITKTLFESIGYDGKSLNFQDGLKGLGDSMMADITKQIDGTTGLLTMYNGVKVIVDGDYDTAEGIFKILENVTGNTKLGAFMDMTNQFKILGTVTKSLMNLGAPEFFDKIIEKIDDKDKEQYIKDNIAEGILAGDLDFILFALKHVSGRWILSNYPNAIKAIVSGYTPQYDNDQQITAEEYSKLLRVLNALDSNWDNIGLRHGVKLYDYGLFSNFNSHAKLALLAGGNREHIRCMIGCQGFSETYDTVVELQERFPYYPIR